jgi:drug/metabolite transporter (DMT)-like permease
MKMVAFIVVSIIAAGSGQLLLRAGAMENDSAILQRTLDFNEWTKLLLNLKVIAGLILWTVSSLAYLAVLTRAELSFVYCLGSLNYLIVPLLSYWLFKETISPLRAVGSIIIFVGVAVLIYGKYSEYAKG